MRDPGAAPDDIASWLAAVVNSSDDAIVSKTLDGVITSWNRAAEKMFGYTAVEAVGQHITLIIPEERRPEEDHVLGRIRRGEIVDHFETVRRAKDGRLLDISLTVSPVKDAQGRIIGASKLARDVTERKRADETRARLAAIVDSSDDAIISKTLDGVITSWNRAAEKMFGYTAAEAVGKPIMLIIPEERRFEEEAVLARIRAGRHVEPFDTVRLSKNGIFVSVSISISPLRSAGGAIIGASKIARDVSERKRMERERAAVLADAQAASRARDEFLAMFGHELRNPLAAIASASQVLATARDLPDIDRPRAVIDRQIRHLKRLVDDLLDAARIRAGKVALERRPVDLAQAVDDALRVLQAGPAKGRHVIEVDVDSVTVDADPVRLEQMILNLGTNAVKYTPAGKAIRITGRAEGDQAVLRVEDEGVGIAAGSLSRIFDLFVQGERTAERSQGGLGIGLTLVRTLAEQHGGTVEAASDGPGRGSVFTLRLPRVEVPSAHAGPAASLAARTGRRVLIVEDNDDARDMMIMLLQRQGHEVFAAADGAAAIEMVTRLQPEVALIDIGLPILDGYEVARHIRRQPYRVGRLIALTGYGQPEDRARCLAAGFDEHLVKPVDPERLAEALATRS